MGPRHAATKFLELCGDDTARFEVTIYGSMAATGKGHLTDKAIVDVLDPVAPTNIIWKPEVFLPFHPNGMTFRAFGRDGN